MVIPRQKESRNQVYAVQAFERQHCVHNHGDDSYYLTISPKLNRPTSRLRATVKLNEPWDERTIRLAVDE